MTHSNTAAIPLTVAVGLAETMMVDQLPKPKVHGQQSFIVITEGIFCSLHFFVCVSHRYFKLQTSNFHWRKEKLAAEATNTYTSRETAEAICSGNSFYKVCSYEFIP